MVELNCDHDSYGKEGGKKKNQKKGTEIKRPYQFGTYELQFCYLHQFVTNTVNDSCCIIQRERSFRWERKKVAEIEPKCLILNCYQLILFSGNFSHLHYSELGGECIGTLWQRASNRNISIRWLIPSNFCVSLPHRRSTAFSSETQL